MQGSGPMVDTALVALGRLSTQPADDATIERLQVVSETDYGDQTPRIRLQAIRLIPAGRRQWSAATFQFVGDCLSLEHDVSERSLAVDILATSQLQSDQLRSVADCLPTTGVTEIRPLLKLFAGASNSRLGLALVTGLQRSAAAATLFPEHLNEALAGFDESVLAKASPLFERISRESQNRLKKMDSVLDLMPQADIRRGMKVFQSSAASCIACHRRAYLGGHIGPDLSRIGSVRTERDLLESILFPSLTFVRNFEPTTIVTADGRIHNGVVRQEDGNSVELQLDAKKSRTLQKSEIDERVMGKTSIMPAGLDKQLSTQQLADLVKYLKEG